MKVILFFLFIAIDIQALCQISYHITDSIYQVNITCTQKQTDTSDYKLSLKVNPSYIFAIKGMRNKKRMDMAIFETKKADSIVGLIWIVTPDIHTVGYKLRIYRKKPFTTYFKVANKYKTISIGFQLVMCKKNELENRKRKWIFVSNDIRSIQNIQEKWFHNIKIN